MTVTDLIDKKRNLAPNTKSYIDAKKYISYSTYIKFRRKINM
jgi:hypothetical protein